MKKLLWIGCIENEEELKAKSQKGYNLASAQVSQKNLIQGIEATSKSVFDSINGSVLPHYPIYEDKVIKEVRWAHTLGAHDISVSYKNVKYINRLTCQHSMIKAARDWVKEYYHGEELIVYVYSMRSSGMATACEIKKLIPTAKLYLIITDLPQFMDLGESKLKSMLKKIDWIQIKRMKHEFDGFILYAEKMADYLNIPNEKWILMEGSYDADELPAVEKENSNKKSIMYSGMIEKKYGLELLVNAFESIDDPNFELWITGGGNDIDYIKECAAKDSRIKFYGFLPSRKEVLVKQQEATMLINMRLPSESASAYCFPSKLFEYMASGTPVLSFNLDGIPKEYYKYLIEIEKESVSEIAASIKKAALLSENEREHMGNTAKKFVLENKTQIEQSKRIINFSF